MEHTNDSMQSKAPLIWSGTHLVVPKGVVEFDGNQLQSDEPVREEDCHEQLHVRVIVRHVLQQRERDRENVKVQKGPVHLFHRERERSGHVPSERIIRFHEPINRTVQIEEPVRVRFATETGFASTEARTQLLRQNRWDAHRFFHFGPGWTRPSLLSAVGPGLLEQVGQQVLALGGGQSSHIPSRDTFTAIIHHCHDRSQQHKRLSGRFTAPFLV